MKIKKKHTINRNPTNATTKHFRGHVKQLYKANECPVSTLQSQESTTDLGMNTTNKEAPAYTNTMQNNTADPTSSLNKQKSPADARVTRDSAVIPTQKALA